MIHVERPVALRIRQARDAVHFRGVEQVLVEVGLIDEDLVDAQLLEGEGIVLALAVGALLELGDEALFGFLQFLDQPPVVVLLRLWPRGSPPPAPQPVPQ